MWELKHREQVESTSVSAPEWILGSFSDPKVVEQYLVLYRAARPDPPRSAWR